MLVIGNRVSTSESTNVVMRVNVENALVVCMYSSEQLSPACGYIFILAGIIAITEEAKAEQDRRRVQAGVRCKEGCACV